MPTGLTRALSSMGSPAGGVGPTVPGGVAPTRRKQVSTAGPLSPTPTPTPTPDERTMRALESYPRPNGDIEACYRL